MKVWLPAIRAGTGADVFTERLAAGLREKGVNTVVTWFNHYLELAPLFMKPVAAPPGTDIVHANSWNGFAFDRKGTKLVITVHLCVSDNTLRPYKTPLQSAYHDLLIQRFEARSFRVADCVTAVSRYTGDRVRELFNIGDVNVIYNGIDTDFFSPGPPRKDNGRFRLLFVGKPSTRKGFDLLGPIMQCLGDDYELYYTGKPGSGPTAGIRNVHATGTLEKDTLLQAYRDCDALLFPSRLEGFGYSVCEAMACGKPVIASDNSSLSEIVTNGETGLLCRTDDVNGFCEAIRKIADSPDYAEKMGRAGRQYVLDHFTLGQMIDNYIAVYNDLLKA